jgi:hypothetical protein
MLINQLSNLLGRIYLRIFVLFFLCLASLPIHAQKVNPIITLGVPTAVQNQTIDIQVLVSSPNYSPMPTGVVDLDWGDGYPGTSASISDTRADGYHAYTTLGTYTLQAYYEGDSNYNAATASISLPVVQQQPTFTLLLFGDSIVGGYSGAWPGTLSSTLGVSAWGFAGGGYRTPDEAPAVYGMLPAVNSWIYSTPLAGNISLYMLGQNDSTLATSTAGLAQYQAAYLASAVWLTIVEGQGKYSAQDPAVAQTGSWSVSDQFSSIGLKSSTAGSTLSASLTGNVLYLGLTFTPTTDYTVDVTVDGVDQGKLSPVSSYIGNAAGHIAAQDGLRYALGGSLTAKHTVVITCANPGTSGCYVDFVASNGYSQGNSTPSILLGTPYMTGAPFPTLAQAVRSVAAELSGDGLGVGLADIAGNFNGILEGVCLADGVHPDQCGNNILETMWLSGLTYLATEAQRIDLTSPGSGSIISAPISATLGTPFVLSSTASSGLPVSYTLLSGSATLKGSTLTAQHTGLVNVQVAQPGNLLWQPAASATLPVQFNPAPTTTGIATSTSTAPYNSLVQLVATVTSDIGTPSGTVSFYSSGALLGSASLSPAGVAYFSMLLAYGADTVTASYAGDGDYQASTSSTAMVQVLAPPAALTLNLSGTGSNVITSGSGIMSVLTITPSIGFQPNVTLSCSSLPIYASCHFAPVNVVGATNAVPGFSSLVVETTRTATVASARTSTLSRFGLASLLVAGLALFPRRKRIRCLTQMLLLIGMAALVGGLSGCALNNALSTPTGTYTLNITATASDGTTTVTTTIPYQLTVK